MTTDQRYQSAYEKYSRLIQIRKLTLSEFCNEEHLYYSGMRKWLSEHKLSLKGLRSQPQIAPPYFQ